MTYEALPYRNELGPEILDLLVRREHGPIITLLDRRMEATPLTGYHLRRKAELCIAQWESWFGPGPHLLVSVLPAGEAFVVALLAALIGGHTIAPLVPHGSSVLAHPVRLVAESCRATAVLCTAAQREKIESILADGHGQLVCTVICADTGAVTHSHILPAAGGIAGAVPIIQHTSGSTRLPKAVPIPAAQIRANCDMIRRLWRMDPKAVVVSWLPHYHDMGLMGGILYPLLIGARSIQMSPYAMIRSPIQWLRAISDHHGTFSGGPAFAYTECMNRISDEDCEGLDLSSWRHAFCGAEPVPAGLLERFQRRFAKHGLRRDAVFSCYGMAECTLFAAGEPWQSSTPKPPPLPVSVAPCRLTYETRRAIRIIDSVTGEELADGTLGEIWISGPSIAPGYHNLPDETAAAFVEDPADGRLWLRTGDLGLIARDALYVTGRQKDVIVVNGRKIAAADVEWIAAEQHPALNPMAAAAFVPPQGHSGHAVLFIETRPGCSQPEDVVQIEQRIARIVRGSLSIHLDEIRILPRGTLPRSTSGKIQRQKIAAAFRPVPTMPPCPEKLISQ